jgi:topoisomerase IV subunit A
MGKRLIPPEKGEVEEVALREALEERYLAYALSTIMNRALPDARDGLKPVHRRILYGMRTLRLDPNSAFKKSAKVVGDVMGNFHPHGDQAIYDAMVRLAQDFAQRYPLIDGQGNFGNIDGDGAAAYRYTEARLTEVARLLLDGIDEDAVDFRPNYDGLSQEPHAVKDAAMHRLEPVARVRERAVHDGGERVGEIALLQRLAQRDLLHFSWRGGNQFLIHGATG